MAELRKRREIARLLLAWYARGHRDLPWRKTTNPYHVWISEIMLQQTRAQAVIPYYQRFLARFPTVEALAAAKEEDALALWSGLGYYSRARNLLRAARLVQAAGAFPAEYAAIRELPGVGDYTAAAIASMTFGLPHVVVDGNVLRVVARVQNDAAEIGSARTRGRFREVAQEWLDPRRPGIFNQALMELGATVCLPKKPVCAECPLRTCCAAHAAGTAARLPVKLRKMQAEWIEGVLLVIRKGGKVLLGRGGKGIARVEGFWQLPAPGDLPDVKLGACLGEFRHTITFHHYTLRVHRARLGDRNLASVRSGAGEQSAFGWFRVSELPEIPLSTTARKGLKIAELFEKTQTTQKQGGIESPRKDAKPILMAPGRELG